MISKTESLSMLNTDLKPKSARILPKLKHQAALAMAFVVFAVSLVKAPTVSAQLVSSEPNKLCDLKFIIANVIRVSASLAGIALFAMLVYGGFLYLSSGGDPKGTEQAKNTITYAIAGIALLAGAWFVLFFLETFTGVKVTAFDIPCP